MLTRAILDAINRQIQPVHARMRNMLARGIVKLVNDDGKMQLVQVSVMGATRADVERFQQYGFTSVPKDGAEAVVVNLGATGDHPVVIVVEDRRYRLKGLEGGEVAMFNDQGAKLVMKANGDVELTPKSGQKFKVTADDVEITGNLSVGGTATVDGDVSVSGDVDSNGTVTGSTDCVGGGKSLKSHTHSGSALTTASSCTAGGSTGTVSGNTGAPN